MSTSVTVNRIPLPPSTDQKTPGTLVLRDANGAAALDLKPGTVIDGSSTTPALRVTQTGSGDALLVEDSANPDSTPLVVNNVGQIISGATTAFSNTAGLQITADSSTAPNANINIQRCSSDAASAALTIQKARGSLASQSVVSNGDQIGIIRFQGHDGGSSLVASAISSVVDGAAGSGDMPGRLVFSTTADGSSTVTERMRITSAGNVGIGTATPNSKAMVDISSTTRGFLPPRMTEAERDAITSPPAGLMLYNSTTNKLQVRTDTTWVDLH